MKSLLLPVLATAALASEHVFSVHDDVLAYPQYEVVYSESYISNEEARVKLREQSQREVVAEQEAQGTVASDLSAYDASSSGASDAHQGAKDANEFYELMRTNGRPYLCSIPILKPSSDNETSQPISEAEQANELARAANRGWELLQGLEDSCIYYLAGWWSYSFCYNSQVKQFHQLPPSQGAPMYPPQEDPTTPTFILGRFNDNNKDGKEKLKKTRTDVAELQTKGETRYLVKKLSGGTVCDLTGKDRKVEIQFHCNPQSTDRIGFIKEVTTCSYLMVIHTPRLCNDVAFLPPQDNKPHAITCREILTTDQVSEWKSKKEAEVSKKLLDGKPSTSKVVGNIEIGGHKIVGGEGRRIEKGKVVTSPEERANVVAKSEGGKVKQLSKEDMKKMKIDPEEIEQFRKELQEYAGDKDWKLEVVEDSNGGRRIQGIVESDSEDEDEDEKGMKKKNKGTNKAEPEEANEGTEGSEEQYKEEL